jgi:dTDP-4-amino-4,6-dideoxygalactose transaminase
MVETNRFIPIARPWLDETELEAVKSPILSGWVTQGPEVAAFEAEFAAAVSARHACAVSSCTTALHLALLAMGVGPGDEVVTVSHSFIATANSIRYCGATPVLVDVQPGTYNINPALIEAAITECTRAILCVHQMGMPCDLQAIMDIAQLHALPVIEDAACAVGSEILWHNQWEKIGQPHGDIGRDGRDVGRVQGAVRPARVDDDLVRGQVDGQHAAGVSMPSRNATMFTLTSSQSVRRQGVSF